MTGSIMDLPVGEAAKRFSALADCVALAGADKGQCVSDWLRTVGDDALSQIGMNRDSLCRLVETLNGTPAGTAPRAAQTIRTLTVLGGRDKAGRPEELNLTLHAGEICCIVGPTGSGKSRLLADIECLAQGDTPTGRRILIDGVAPAPGFRFSGERKPIAQISQNMNFVVDLTVGAFLDMHAACCGCEGAAIDGVVACANALVGEPIRADMPLTQLSGGQTRGLMIADTAMLSRAPVVLIDEIENAGIDRKQALEVLVAREKIVLISTHDPLLALLGKRRLVVRGGAVADVLETDADERANLAALESCDRILMDLRRRIRSGERVDFPIDWSGQRG
jgi:ABC-type lipoprotein export system ATPase subunit